MTCESVAELIGPYLDNDLPTETRRRVEVHLLRCAACAWEAQSLRIAGEQLREDAEEVVASDAFRARVLSRLRADNPHIAPAEPVPDDALQYQLLIGLF